VSPFFFLGLFFLISVFLSFAFVIVGNALVGVFMYVCMELYLNLAIASALANLAIVRRVSSGTRAPH
jgi:hypothetical protein